MSRTPIRLVLLSVTLLSLIATTFGQDYPKDDNEKDARVARISVLSGEAKVQRIESQDWEKVVQNLPAVEGDTYVTESNSRLEIQLDRFNFLRLDEESSLKLTFLGEDGIALSLSKGSIGVSLSKFDFDQSYLEIDAPSTTVTIQKDGIYRVDAGDEFNKEVRVIAGEDSQARVYSKNAGFVIRNNQTTRLFLEGNLAGEWETSRKSRISDDFDSWLEERDDVTAGWIDDVDDDDNQYLDDDVYGADDLDNNGNWTYDSRYGHIWRPNRRATSQYSNWSPYRYGQWRWLPYYGWTWVNDEPWGWATYHSGRWIFHRGAWYWSPHRRYRRGGSWWRPAIVFVATIGRNVCWYPLPYGYDYYDYNRRFGNRWGRRNGRRGNRRNNNGPRGGGASTPVTTPQANIDRAGRNSQPPLGRVPAGGVVTTDRSAFGRGRTGIRRPPLAVAEETLKRRPIVTNSPPLLPDLRDLNGKKGRDVSAPVPRTKIVPVRTGVITRKNAAPLDEKLRRSKINGNRIPRMTTPIRVNNRRTTGNFERTRSTPRTTETTRKKVVKRSPPIVPTTTRKTTTTKSTESTKPRTTTRTRKPPVDRTKPKRRTTTTRSTINRRTETKRKPPADRPKPKRRTETRRSAPKRTTPKRSAPTRKSTPKRSAPKKVKRTKRPAPKRSAPTKKSSSKT